MWRLVLGTLAVSVVLVPTVVAQEPAAEGTTQTVVVQPPTGPPPFVNLRGFSKDYQVGPGDQLSVQVVGHDDLRQSLRVSNTGEISFPMLGLIRVADLTAFEIETEIANRLRENGLVLQPEVMVFISDYQAKPIYVSGAVVHPGEYIMSQDLTVMDAVLLAGGLRFNAADEGLLHRRISPEGQGASAAAIAANPDVARRGIEIIKVDLRPLKEGRFVETSLPLRRGDVLVVPEQLMNAFFVVGELIAPRNFFYPPGKTLMASQAISWAQGPLPTAKMSDGMLVRYDAQGRRTELKVDYDAILKGKQADFAIQPYDIIFIPGSKIKTIAHGMLLSVDNYMMSASFRVGRNIQRTDPPTSDAVPPE